MLDYAVGLLLIAAPWLFGFARGGAETWLPVALGAGAIGYRLLTEPVSTPGAWTHVPRAGAPQSPGGRSQYSVVTSIVRSMER